MAVTDGFLPAGMLADLLDREINFDEAFRVLNHCFAPRILSAPI